ncbi:major capsid protein [Microvirus sp.]|nr:major capsid protein [Microvirus sp.]
MNRNSEQHYSQVPHAEIRRARFKRDFSLLTTMNEGDLVPIYCDEVLPADTFKINLNSLVRMATPLYPVMDNAYMDFYFFFVPARLLWEHFVNLMGQNDKTFWAENTEYTTPVTTAPTGGWKVGTIADYFGIPTGVSGLKVNSMPFRAYVKIWNEWFRDENLQQPAQMTMGDETTTGSNDETNSETSYITEAQKGAKPLKVCKYKDYFTSCLPSPLKAAEPVRIPMNGNAPVGMFHDSDLTNSFDQSKKIYLNGTGEGTPIAQLWPNNKGGKTTLLDGATTSKGNANSGAYLGADLSKVSATTINELRNAIAVQHIFERDARTGTRYKEILNGAWGVTSPDARLDRSEYIGGYRMPININQVIQTSSTDTTSPQGNTAAYSMTTLSREMCTYSATEHGYVIGLAAARVDHSYQQGLSRMWTRSTRFSYYDPMLANLGEQAVLNQEIYAQGNATDTEVFGYQEAWADYRYRTNMVTSEMRSTYKQTLDAWHYADKYSKLPKLSSSWIKEGTENIDRTLAVQSSNSHQFICNFYFDQTWTRPMPIYSVPGLDTI